MKKINKRGFTLVEIIICIVLIVGIGTISLVVINKNDNNKLEEITNKILEAANVYIAIEKDNNGNIYANEIIKGAKGVQIPLSNLLNKGYIEESLVNQVYELNPHLDNHRDYYVLFVHEIGGENESDCNLNEITSYVSWMPKGDNIYLCNNYSFSSGDEPEYKTLIENILEPYTIDDGSINVQIKDTISKNDYYHQDFTGTNESGYFSKQNGLFKRNDGTYYYRGMVGDNYVKIFNDLFRIISFDTNTNKIRVIKETYSGASFPSSYQSDAFSINAYAYYMGYIRENCRSRAKDSTYCYNIFTTGEFCYEEQSIPYYFSSSIHEFNCSSTPISQNWGLISVDEAIFAGIPTFRLKKSDYVLNSLTGGGSSHALFGNSWLTSGSSTFTINKSYGSDVVILNEFYQDDPAALLGIFYEVDIRDYSTLKSGNKFNDKIRPVLILDNAYTKVKGKGTKDSPYELIIELKY